jgi:hypothetical protein
MLLEMWRPRWPIIGSWMGSYLSLHVNIAPFLCLFKTNLLATNQRLTRYALEEACVRYDKRLDSALEDHVTYRRRGIGHSHDALFAKLISFSVFLYRPLARYIIFLLHFKPGRTFSFTQSLSLPRRRAPFSNFIKTYLSMPA